MFGGFKKFFSKEAEAPVATPAAPPPSSPSARPGPTAGQPSAAAPAPQPARVAPRPPLPPGEVVNVPLKSILAKLPANLAALIKTPGSGNFPLPLATAVSQLRSGAVRIPFGDLRASAPAGTFADNSTLDDILVDMPLADVLPLINPALLPKRTGQKRVYVSEDVTSVFGKDKTPKASAQITGPATSREPEPAPAPVAIPVPVAKAPEPAPIPMAPSVPIAMPTISLPKPAAPAPAPAPVVAPKPPTPPSIPVQAAPKPVAPAPAPLPSFAPKPAAPAPAPVAAPVAAAAGDLIIPLGPISETWPPALRQEISNAGLQGANIVAPMPLIEPAMRGGKLAFTWGDLSKWIQPAPSFSFAPDTMLDLPLKVIIPLFMAQRKGGGVQKKVAVDEKIPDLFGGNRAKAPEPAPAPAPVAAAPEPAPAPLAMPAPAPVAAAPVAMPTISLPKPAAPVPVPAPVDDGSAVVAALESTGWAPKDVVAKLCTLKGVGGALIATSDGLAIADELPVELNPENMAAFMPQSFVRMGQYTKELQLGALGSVTMVVGETPCAIYKTGAIYLVVVGKAKESLPAGILNRIATELATRNP